MKWEDVDEFERHRILMLLQGYIAGAIDLHVARATDRDDRKDVNAYRADAWRALLAEIRDKVKP